MSYQDLYELERKALKKKLPFIVLMVLTAPIWFPLLCLWWFGAFVWEMVRR